MGERCQLRAADGFTLGGYRALPANKPKGGLVVIQEIFGVNAHIRAVTDGYAKAGYAAIAPQIFDRVERDIELGYEQNDMVRGIGIARASSSWTTRCSTCRRPSTTRRVSVVGVVGYCFRGLLTV
jgi:carboxymethylenebutenolidase